MLHAPSVASRRRLACIAGVLAVAFATMGGRTVAAGVAVVVDGSPLHLKPGPIERVGRIFVPLRGIFERLGASVVYQNRQINSTKGSTSVSLAIGSRQATVNGQPQTIDVAPFIVGATTYVPLRFVAQSLGAVVSYDGAARLVEITVPRQPPSIPATPPNPPPVSIIQLIARQPAPGTLTGNRFTPIAAQFSHAVDVDSVRVWLDGKDVTSRSGVSPSGFSYEPPAPLDFGTHTVRVAGLDRGGLRFTRSWSFTTTRPAPPPQSPVQLRNQEPSPNATVENRRAVVAANFVPQADAASVRVRLDGSDITVFSGVSPGGFSYKPLTPLELGTHTVRVSGRGRAGLPFDHSWSFTTARTPTPRPSPTPPPETPVQLRDQRPSPGATVHDRFAVVAANFAPQADGPSVRIRLDGNDITVRSAVSSGGFSYKPPAPLEFGTHSVRVVGRGQAGLAFDHSWSFTTARTPTPPPSPTPPPENPVQLRDQQPSAGAVVHDRFAVVAANFAPQADGASVHVRLDGTDITERSGVSSGGFSYKPSAPLEFGSHKVRVSGRGRSGLPFDHSWSFTVRRTGPIVTPTLPPTPQPTAAPTRAPRVIPTAAPTPQPTPTPTRAPRVIPTATPTATPTGSKPPA